MINHARFQHSLNFDTTLNTIHWHIKMLVNSSKKNINNDISDYTILKFILFSKRNLKKTLGLSKSFRGCLLLDELKISIDSVAKG